MRGRELLGQTLGRYRITHLIGSGATGLVFRAETPEGQPVALKVLETVGSISALERRFEREAKVLKRLSHPNIVQSFDFALEQDRTYIAMELLEGHTLEQELTKGPLPPQTVLEYCDPILEALSAAHELEIVHRDLKPANVFLTDSGQIKLLDFGLAKMLSLEEIIADGTLTRKGRIVGTPAYMAPEQITGLMIDVRADVYSFGVMLFELLADRRPFPDRKRSDLLRAHLLNPPPRITEVRPGLWVHPELEKLLNRALAKDPDRRYDNGAHMLRALRELPPGCVRLDSDADTSIRRGASRRGPITAAVVLPNAERHAVTVSAGISTERTRNPGPDPHAEANAETQIFERPSLAAQPSGSNIFALVLLLLGLFLLGTAGMLFYLQVLR